MKVVNPPVKSEVEDESVCVILALLLKEIVAYSITVTSHHFLTVSNSVISYPEHCKNRVRLVLAIFIVESLTSISIAMKKIRRVKEGSVPFRDSLVPS